MVEVEVGSVGKVELPVGCKTLQMAEQVETKGSRIAPSATKQPESSGCPLPWWPGAAHRFHSPCAMSNLEGCAGSIAVELSKAPLCRDTICTSSS